jgi:hypothetical protein
MPPDRCLTYISPGIFSSHSAWHCQSYTVTNHKRASWTAIDILEAAPRLFPSSSSSSFIHALLVTSSFDTHHPTILFPLLRPPPQLRFLKNSKLLAPQFSQSKSLHPLRTDSAQTREDRISRRHHLLFLLYSRACSLPSLARSLARSLSSPPLSSAPPRSIWQRTSVLSTET